MDEKEIDTSIFGFLRVSWRKSDYRTGGKHRQQLDLFKRGNYMKTKILIAPVILLLAGCANFNSVHRDFNISNGNGALIDIKQRAIIASVVKTKKSDNTEITETRVCAEPSPDSLSAYAAELAAKADNGQVAAGLSAAFQESSAFVGLRTQSIQLLRDASYRLCESYLELMGSASNLGKPQSLDFNSS